MKLKIILACILGSVALQYSYGQNHVGQHNFWQSVRFGGGIGLGFTNGGFNGYLSPSAVYDFNPYVSTGASLSLNYAKYNNNKFLAYGGSVLTLFNPISQIQLSAEFEELRINKSYSAIPNTIEDNYWLPALFVGAGFRTRHVTIGLRYDVLYNENKSVYASPLTPFFRVYF